jgi:hypothetical protein
MKAIIIVDIYDKKNINDLLAFVKLKDESNNMKIFDEQRFLKLKPLPLKKTDFEDMMFSWNDCIDEILGGEENE